MKKISILFSAIIMLFYMFTAPISALATTQIANENNEQTKDAVIISETGEDVPLYETIENFELLMELPHGLDVELLEEFEEYSLIKIIIEEDEALQGYVGNEFLLIDETDLDDQNAENETNSDEQNFGDATTPEPKSDNPLTDTDIAETERELEEKQPPVFRNFATFSSSRELLTGVAKRSPTNIRTTTSTKSKIANQLPIGHVLQVRFFNDNWYEAIVDGKTVGYIHRKHVTIVRTEPESVRGVAKKSKTNIRAGASTKSKVATHFPIGTVLNLKTFSKNWYSYDYQGKTGYLHRKHVTIVRTVPENVRGVAKKSTTNIRAGASTKAKVAKRVKIGHVLDLRTFSKNWNEVREGGKVVGYIHRKHVTIVRTKPESLRGVAKKSTTNIRAGASTKAKVAKKVKIGHVLDLRTFSKNWNEVREGGRVVGYIHRKHVTIVRTVPKDEKAVTLRSPTNVRAGASTKAEVLTRIRLGTIIDVKTFSKNWYSFTSQVNGKTQTGYIHRKHIGDKAVKTTRYNLTLTQALNIQMPKLRIASAPSTMYVRRDALELKKGNWEINSSKGFWDIRSKPDSKTPVIGQLSNGKTTSKITVDLANSTKNYYKFKTTWIIPTRSATERYLNPANFKENTPEYFQFLVLSQPAGTNPTELNNKILKGKGVLAGKGSSFIKASRDHNINELYLISHAELETGNGTSALAKGVEVGKAKDGKVTLVTKSNKSQLKDIKTVHNMFGIGAVDGDALKGGAIRAYNLGWTSVEKAIEGGAKFIREDYIDEGGIRHSGQDTLYKMRWHPEGMVKDGAGSWHQYATDIQWATKQTVKLKSYYDKLGTYKLSFDVPSYK